MCRLNQGNNGAAGLKKIRKVAAAVGGICLIGLLFGCAAGQNGHSNHSSSNTFKVDKTLLTGDDLGGRYLNKESSSKTVFSTDEKSIASHVYYSGVEKPHSLRWAWVDPSGKLYYQTDNFLITPSSEDSYIEEGVATHRISVKNDLAANFPGQWHVKIFCDDALAASESFTIEPLPTGTRLPPYLTIENISFSKNVLEADDTAMLKLTLHNTGMGDAKGVYVLLESSTANLIYTKKHEVPTLPGEKGVYTLEVPIKGSMDLPSGDAFLDIQVVEPNFNVKIQGKRLRFQTRKFSNPELIIAKFAALEGQSSNKNFRIDKNEMVHVKFAVQNIGHGQADQVSLNIENQQAGVKFIGICAGEEIKWETLQNSPSISLMNIASGDYRIVNGIYFVNSDFTDKALVFQINASEKYGEYGFKEKKIVGINTKINPEGVIRHVAVAPNTVLAEKAVSISDIPDFEVDVDVNIPETGHVNPDAVAVVIGNRNYEFGDIPEVKYAMHDAEVMKNYLVKTLGYREKNIIFKTNATRSDFNNLFGVKDNPHGMLDDYIKPGQSDVFVYYSGHGAPDPDTRKAYFVPVNCMPTKIALNGYPLDVFYENIAALEARSITVVIDACFSGGTNSGKNFVKNASPAVINTINPVVTREDTVCFTSCDGDQISSWYDEKKHGLFTYFYLKALQGNADRDKDHQLTFNEIYQYTADRQDGVPYIARRLHSGRNQMPQLIGKNPDRVFVMLKN